MHWSFWISWGSLSVEMCVHGEYKCLYACMSAYVCMHAHVCLGVLPHEYIGGGQRLKLSMSLYHFPRMLWGRVSHWTYCSLIQLDWPDSKVLGSSCPPFSINAPDTHCHIWGVMWVLGIWPWPITFAWQALSLLSCLSLALHWGLQTGERACFFKNNW